MRRWRPGFGLCLVCFALGLRALAQTPENGRGELPPNGPYGVGRVPFHWVDGSRREALSKDPKARRELMVHLFYPTDPGAEGSPAPYIPEVELMRVYEEKHFGKDFMREEYGEAYGAVFNARTHSIAGARLSGARRKYPVLLFQPGLGIKVFLYTAIIEELASRGYVVAAVEPPYETSVVVFPGGRIVEEHDDWGNVYMNGTREQAARFHLARIDVNAEDNSFVLNQLFGLNAGVLGTRHPDFKGRLDVRRAGAFGHSQGGLAARRSCQIDLRWKACIDLGGGLGEEEITSMGDDPIHHPFMLMTPAMKNRKLIDHDDSLFRNAKSPSYKVSVEAPGFGHFIYYDFEMPGARAEASRNGLSASDRLRDTQIIRAYTLAFFDRYILGRRAPSLNDMSKSYEEVTLEKFGPAAR
jgi:hypothetical protein